MSEIDDRRTTKNVYRELKKKDKKKYDELE